MTTGEIDVVRFSDAWGRSPSTFTLVTLAVGIAPDAVAFEGANGPITFAALHARAAVTAGVLQAQGLDADASIAASISGFVDTSGKSPVEVAALVHGTAASIRSAAIAVVGTSDWESLPGLFRSAAHRFADRPAVTDQLGATMTYGELDALTDRIAAALVERGVRPSAVVALALPRTIGIPIAILAVLKAGATYVPFLGSDAPRNFPLELSLASASAHAQAAYPTQAIKFIVPYAAGGSSDTRSRQLAQKLSDSLGVPVVVDNKPGASGNIGTGQIATAKPDGYTIGLASLPGVMVSIMDPDRKAAYKKDDFQPIALQVLDAGVIAVKADITGVVFFLQYLAHPFLGQIGAACFVEEIGGMKKRFIAVPVIGARVPAAQYRVGAVHVISEFLHENFIVPYEFNQSLWIKGH